MKWENTPIVGDSIPQAGDYSLYVNVEDNMSMWEHALIHCSLLLIVDLMGLAASSSCHAVFAIMVDNNLELLVKKILSILSIFSQYIFSLKRDKTKIDSIVLVNKCTDIFLYSFNVRSQWRWANYTSYSSNNEFLK